MRFYDCLTICLLGLISLSMAGVDSAQADMIDRMKAGGHILMIRHALAPGSGDPTHFRIGDCSTQRNLDDRGRKQARAIGDWLRSKGITTARIYSSQWCRCLETAELLRFGPVTQLPALNSFYELPQDREPNLKALRKFIAEQDANGPLIIIVTHFVTISAITSQGVSSGEGVLVELKKDTPVAVVGRLSFGGESF
jgi:phosphohistidine phosphatase SixA